MQYLPDDTDFETLYYPKEKVVNNYMNIIPIVVWYLQRLLIIIFNNKWRVII